MPPHPHQHNTRQVHKAKLRTFSPAQLRAARRASSGRTSTPGEAVVGEGQSAWDVCSTHGVSLGELARLNKGGGGWGGLGGGSWGAVVAMCLFSRGLACEP